MITFIETLPGGWDTLYFFIEITIIATTIAAVAKYNDDRSWRRYRQHYASGLFAKTTDLFEVLQVNLRNLEPFRKQTDTDTSDTGKQQIYTLDADIALRTFRFKLKQDHEKIVDFIGSGSPGISPHLAMIVGDYRQALEALLDLIHTLADVQQSRDFYEGTYDGEEMDALACENLLDKASAKEVVLAVHLGHSNKLIEVFGTSEKIAVHLLRLGSATGFFPAGGKSGYWARFRRLAMRHILPRKSISSNAILNHIGRIDDAQVFDRFSEMLADAREVDKMVEAIARSWSSPSSKAGL